MNNTRRNVFVGLCLALAAGGLLLASLRLPLWHLHMESPQYQGQEALNVYVLPSALQGSLGEIKLLEQYIGVRVPDTLPQTRWLPIIMWLGAGLGLMAALLPLRVRRFAAFGLAGLLALAMLTAAIQAQGQMYHLGHDRNRHAALQGVGDFTPPLLGNLKVANFELESRLGWGAALIAGAVAMYVWLGLLARPRPTLPKRSLTPMRRSETEVAKAELSSIPSHRSALGSL